MARYVKIFLKLVMTASLVAIAVASFAISNNIKDQTKQAAKTAPDPIVSSINSQIQSSHFQAIFMGNGQVYFGKLQRIDAENYKLNDVYYLDKSATLVKLGNESHKPQDSMVIPVASVNFWENLKDANQFGGQLQ